MLLACLVHYYCGNHENLSLPIKSLLRITTTRPDQETYVALKVIQSLSKQQPELFSSHYRFFAVNSMDQQNISELKLEILENIVSPMNIGWIINELKVFIFNFLKVLHSKFRYRISYKEHYQDWNIITDNA